MKKKKKNRHYFLLWFMHVEFTYEYGKLQIIYAPSTYSNFQGSRILSLASQKLSYIQDVNGSYFHFSKPHIYWYLEQNKAFIVCSINLTSCRHDATLSHAFPLHTHCLPRWITSPKSRAVTGASLLQFQHSVHWFRDLSSLTFILSWFMCWSRKL